MTISHLETDGGDIESTKKVFKKEVGFMFGLKGWIGFQEAAEERVFHAYRTT